MNYAWAPEVRNYSLDKGNVPGTFPSIHSFFYEKIDEKKDLSNLYSALDVFLVFFRSL